MNKTAKKPTSIPDLPPKSDDVMHIRLPKALKEQIQIAARKDMRHPSDWIRILVENHLKTA